MKKFCKSLREHTMKIINFGKKKMKPSSKKQHELHEKTGIYCICKESSYISTLMIETIVNLGNIVIV